MSVKTYRFYCEICNWKRITDGSDIQDLHEYKVAPIPGGVPKRDPVTKKVLKGKDRKPLKRFRCPKCGRPVIPRKIANPQADIDRMLEEGKRAEMVSAAEEEQEKKLMDAIKKSEKQAEERKKNVEQAEERKKNVEEKRNSSDGS